MAWIYFIVGSVCLIALQALRSGLSIVFPTRTVRPGSRPEARQFGGLELIDETTAALSQLGFDGPAWLYCDQQQTDNPVVEVHAVYRNVAKNTVAWVAPVMDLSQPHQLLCYYTTALDDGRFAVTQVCDPYYSAVDDPQTPAQTIPAGDKPTELQQHLEFVASLGANPIANVPIREAVMRFAGEHMNSIRKRLLERGRLREKNGIARPTFGFAAALLRKVASRPVTPENKTRSIPTARLAYLASVSRRNSERAPAQSTQWLLLLISALLFIAIGWPLLGRDFTIIILAVILFHEAGHWAAMKAFRYRNPHITLLPLLGGVTIGHETDPGAVKRVWVSLAGPLPGIVLGWALMFFLATELDTEFAMQWLAPTIGVLLFVNYLNILPIPPLDGAHIVKAILPPSWIAVQIVVVIIGVIAGVYVAWLLDFWPLALISLSQLLAIRGMWTDAALIRHFGRERPPDNIDEDGRTEWLLEKLETKLGAPKKANKRIQTAQTILNQLDMRPMGMLHRTGVSALYLALVAVPLGVMGLTSMGAWSFDMNPETEAMYEELDKRQQELAAQARSMTNGELLHDLFGESNIPGAATGQQIAAAESRLGLTLPGHLQDFYREMNGSDVLGLYSVDAIRRVDPALFATGDLQFHVIDGELQFYDADYEAHAVPVDAVAGWLQIGVVDGWQYRFVEPHAASGEMAVFGASPDELTAHEDVTGLLRDLWLSERSAELYAASTRQLTERAAERMKDDSIEELLDTFPKAGFLERLIVGSNALPAGADEALLAATERRIGHTLPDDHRRILLLHNGFSPLSLFAAEDIETASRVADRSFDDLLRSDGPGNVGLTLDEFHRCWIIAGYKPDPGDSPGVEEIYGHIYWCPELDSGRRYISQLNDRFHPSLTSVVRQAAAAYAAW